MKHRWRLLPHPLGSLLLWIAWLVMNGTLAFAHVVLGAIVAIAIPALTHPLWPERLHVRRPLKLARLVAVVLYDIVEANIQVAIRILGPVSRLKPAFVTVPVDLANPYAVATLASIITLTPGTVSSELSPDRRFLLVHALDVADPDALVANIKARYETPLKEILP